MRYLLIKMLKEYKRFVKWFRATFIPKSLLRRILLIIIVPTIIAQVISSYMFYKRHWDNVRKYMIYTLAGEISLISKMHDMDEHAHSSTNEKIDAYTFLQYSFIRGAKPTPNDQKLSKELRILKSNIQYNLPGSSVFVRYNKHSKEIEVELGTKEGMFVFEVSKNRIYSSSTHAFILWMIGSTMILLLLTVLFAKNQIKSITKLSTAADKFSRGYPVKKFTPQGAIEVKKAGHAIIKMKEKIEEQVTQKAKMLAGVSHDLRTPITRLKLELELMKSEKNIQGLKEDIMQMEHTINDYLDFAKGDGDRSERKLVKLNDLLEKLVAPYKKTFPTKLVYSESIYAEIKQNQIKRAFGNFIDNAKKFASHALIELYKKDGVVFIVIHDNGPGIPKSEEKKVLQPFYRIDASRNQNAGGGVGLGMSISQEIIENHQGSLHIGRSPKLGGMLVIIELPEGTSSKTHQKGISSSKSSIKELSP